MEAFEVEREVARELSPSEKLLWSGQPRQGVMFRPSDAAVIWSGVSGWQSRQQAAPALEGIPSARSVYELLRQAQTAG